MTAAAPPPEHLIDLQRFSTLYGAASLLLQVAPVFQRQADAWLTAIEQACATCDEAQVLHLLHKMKGSCAGLCATQLVADLAAAEQVVQRLGMRESLDSLERIASAIRCLNQFLDSVILQSPCTRDPPDALDASVT